MKRGVDLIIVQAGQDEEQTNFRSGGVELVVLQRHGLELDVHLFILMEGVKYLDLDILRCYGLGISEDLNAKETI